MDIASILQSYKVPSEKKSKITNKRQELIKEFADRLNADRVSSGRKELSPKFYAVKLSTMTTDQLYGFLGDCKQAKNFSSYWWWNTNPKNFQ